MNLIDKVRIKIGNFLNFLKSSSYRFLNVIFPKIFNIQERKKDIYPLGYSYPSELFLNVSSPKTNVWAEVIPGLRETYRFDTEQEYYKMYQSSRFAFTWKKGGWDCLRHYEIIANGCLPVFRDIDQCPDDTLVNLPKYLLQRINKELIPWRETKEHEQLYQTLSSELLDYCLESTTCEKTANKFLEILGLPGESKILLLTCDPGPNYSREFTFIGLNRVLKENAGLCISYPELSHIYQDFPLSEAQKLYGKGFGYARKIKRSHPKEKHPWTKEEIRNSILTKEWDYILFGKVGVDETHLGSIPNLPFWKEIFATYTKKQIGFLYGGDHMQNLSDVGSSHTRHLLEHAKYGSCFVRELSL